MAKQTIKFTVQKYPEFTKNIYICGDVSSLGGWNILKAKKLIKNKQTGNFEISIIANVGKSIEYKYLADKNWGKVECGYVLEYISNRRITVNGGEAREIIDDIKNFNR